MTDRISPEFGTVLRQFRLRARLSQDQLADRSGLSVRTVRNLEQGRTQPRPDSVRLLAGALGITGPGLGRFDRAAGLADGADPAVPGVSQLPRDLPDFGERDEAVAAVETALAGTADAVRLLAVTGPAGVGKTALAVHVAHRLRGAYPDGQLYVRIRSGDAEPLTAAEVLGRFLRAVGVDGSAVPPTTEERAALFRSRLAGRRVLLLLDDAVDEEQVRPLLPGDADSAVLLTGRRALSGLEGLRTVPLDVLDAGPSVRMLGRIAGADRVAAEPDAARGIVAACGGLPLALRVSAARLAADPTATLADLAEVLTDERGRLDELAAGDLGVRTSFGVGYRDLDEPARRAFRLLGLLPMPDLPAWTVAAVLDCDPREGRRVAELLVRTGLLTAHRPGRYGLHDLVRLYARERAEAEEQPSVRLAAVRRALSGWAALADEADRRLPSDALALPDRVPPGWRPDPATRDALLRRPLNWFEQERPALVAAVALAAEEAPELAAGLADSLVDFCATRNYPDDWAGVAGTLLRTAEATGDRRLAGLAERRLAELSVYRAHGLAALPAATRALAHAEAAGDLRGAAVARLIHGMALRVSSRVTDCEPYLRQAAADFATVGDPNGAGHTHRELGMLALTLGDVTAAQEHLAAAEQVFLDAGDLRGYGNVLLNRGSAADRAGDLAGALDRYREAQAVFRQTGDRRLLAASAVLTGRTQVRLGDTDAAVVTLTGALADARELHWPDTIGVATLGLAEAHLRAGDLPAARDHFTAAREVFAEVRMAAYEGFAEAGLGEVALAEGDLDAARARLTRAETVLAEAAPPRAEAVRARLAELPAH